MPPRDLTQDEVRQADITDLRVVELFDSRCGATPACSDASVDSIGQWLCRSDECTYDGSDPLEFANGAWRTTGELDGWLCEGTEAFFGLTLVPNAAELAPDGRIVAREALMTVDVEPPGCTSFAVDFLLLGDS